MDTAKREMSEAYLKGEIESDETLKKLVNRCLLELDGWKQYYPRKGDVELTDAFNSVLKVIDKRITQTTEQLKESSKS